MRKNEISAKKIQQKKANKHIHKKNHLTGNASQSVSHCEIHCVHYAINGNQIVLVSIFMYENIQHKFVNWENFWAGGVDLFLTFILSHAWTHAHRDGRAVEERKWQYSHISSINGCPFLYWVLFHLIMILKRFDLYFTLRCHCHHYCQH